MKIIFGQKVEAINFDDQTLCWRVSANSKKNSFIYQAKDVIYTAPPQSLLNI